MTPFKTERIASLSSVALVSPSTVANCPNALSVPLPINRVLQRIFLKVKLAILEIRFWIGVDGKRGGWTMRWCIASTKSVMPTVASVIKRVRPCKSALVFFLLDI